MPAERVRIATTVKDQTMYYVRESEVKKEGRWVALPNFDPDPRFALIMREAVATSVANRMRNELHLPVWMEALDQGGRRIDVEPDFSASADYGDPRTPLAASLDDVNFFKVTPICRPSGRTYFVKAVVPNTGGCCQMFYGEPLECLQHAQDLDLLKFCERVNMTPSQPVVPNSNTSAVPRHRPGSLK